MCLPPIFRFPEAPKSPSSAISVRLLLKAWILCLSQRLVCIHCNAQGSFRPMAYRRPSIVAKEQVRRLDQKFCTLSAGCQHNCGVQSRKAAGPNVTKQASFLSARHTRWCQWLYCLHLRALSWNCDICMEFTCWSKEFFSPGWTIMRTAPSGCWLALHASAMASLISCVALFSGKLSKSYIHFQEHVMSCNMDLNKNLILPERMSFCLLARGITDSAAVFPSFPRVAHFLASLMQHDKRPTWLYPVLKILVNEIQYQDRLTWGWNTCFEAEARSNRYLCIWPTKVLRHPKEDAIVLSSTYSIIDESNLQSSCYLLILAETEVGVQLKIYKQSYAQGISKDMTSLLSFEIKARRAEWCSWSSWRRQSVAFLQPRSSYLKHGCWGVVQHVVRSVDSQDNFWSSASFSLLCSLLMYCQEACLH